MVVPREWLSDKAAANAALEAEMRAAKQREAIPIEERVESFKAMLAEKQVGAEWWWRHAECQVSAFSTWEKELAKIVFDERYLLLGSRERKAAFDDWVKDRAEVEKAERKKRAKEAREQFKAMLAEVAPATKLSYREFEKKYGKEARFRAVEKSREREELFDDYLDEKRKKEKAEKRERQDKVPFAHLLRGCCNFTLTF